MQLGEVTEGFYNLTRPIREMQIQTTLGYHYVPTKSKITVSGTGKKAEQLDLSHFAGEHVNVFSPLENCWIKVLAALFIITPN